ncbi:MAG: hypothetical protein ACOZCL_11020 [Bacillota bacterium]
MIYLLQKKVKGSFTVEASITFTFIIFTIITLIFSTLLICQRVMLQRAANCSAMLYSEILTNGQLYNLDGSFELYSRFKIYSTEVSGCISQSEASSETPTEADSSHDESKIKLIEHILEQNVKKSMLRHGVTNYTVRYNNGFIRDSVKIELVQEVDIPFGFIKSWFDGKSSITVRGVSDNFSIEPDEFIRNIDFLIEYSKRLKDGIDIKGALKKVKSEGD